MWKTKRETTDKKIVINKIDFKLTISIIILIIHI